MQDGLFQAPGGLHVRTFFIRGIQTVLLALAVILALTTLAPAEASSQMTATEAVNVRSSPTTRAQVIGSLSPGQRVTAVKSAGNGWTKITFSGARAAYVKTSYLSASASRSKSASPISSQRAPSLPKVTGTKVATAKLSVRATTDPKGKVLVKLAKGTSVSITGATKGSRAQIVYRGAVRWVNAKKLADPKSERPTLPEVTGTKVATAKLSVRATTDPRGKVLVKLAKGTSVSVTGTVKAGRAQIVYRGAVRWVNNSKLADPDVDGPTAPDVPEVTGVRYATATLDIRSNNTDTYTVVGEVPKGTPLSITGVEANGRAQIVYSNAVRWVTAKYLSSTPPTGGGGGGGGRTPDPRVEKGLKPNAVKTYRAVIRQFPEIGSVGGVRPDSLPDHPSGRALDLMIPNYTSSSGKRMGGDVAAWLKANARDLGINYVIWDQHIWNITRDREGWRYMASRGSDSANHKNHVHVTVFADGLGPR